MGDELYASTETDNIKRVDPKNLKGFDEEYRYLGSLVLKLLPTENRFYRNIRIGTGNLLNVTKNMLML